MFRSPSLYSLVIRPNRGAPRGTFNFLNFSPLIFANNFRDEIRASLPFRRNSVSPVFLELPLFSQIPIPVHLFLVIARIDMTGICPSYFNSYRTPLRGRVWMRPKRRAADSFE